MKHPPIHPDRIHLLSIEERAERRLLPDELSIKDIGVLLYEDKQDRRSFYLRIINACKNGTLQYTGDINECPTDWYFDRIEQSVKYLDWPDKDRLRQIGMEEYWDKAECGDLYDICDPPNCLVHRDNIKEYFESINLWPVTDCLLANWWPESENKQGQDMSINKETLKMDYEKLCRGVDKLPLRAWLGILNLTEHSDTHDTVIRLVKNYGLGLYTQDGDKLNASIDEIENALNEADDLFFKTDDHESKIFQSVKLGEYALESVYVKQSDIANAYGSLKKRTFPWALGYPFTDADIKWLNCDKTMDVYNEQFKSRYDGVFWDNDPQLSLAFKIERDLAIKNRLGTPINSPNNQSLLDEPLEDLLHDEGLQTATGFNRASALYVWRGNLQSELATIKPSDYALRNLYDERVKNLNHKIAEISGYLSNFDNSGYEKNESTVVGDNNSLTASLENAPETKNQGNGTEVINVYQQRKKSFKLWLESEIENLTDKDEDAKKQAIRTFLDDIKSVKAIYNAVKIARKDDINTNKKGKGKGLSLWDINFENTFNSKDFWQRYCREIEYSRKE